MAENEKRGWFSVFGAQKPKQDRESTPRSLVPLEKIDSAKEYEVCYRQANGDTKVVVGKFVEQVTESGMQTVLTKEGGMAFFLRKKAEGKKEISTLLEISNVVWLEIRSS